MSKDLNQCNFIGRLGRDPDIKTLPSGDTVVNFSIACSDDYKDKHGNKIDQTNWINVVAFRRLGEIVAQYVKKGNQVYISGKQVTRKWQDKTGQDRYSTEIQANELQMLGGRADSGAPASPQGPSVGRMGAQPQQEPDYDADLPF